METDWGILRQESSKEMAVNYEILFAGAYNQLPIARTSSDRGFFSTNKSILFTLFTGSADYVLDTDTSLLVSNRPFQADSVSR